MNTYYVIGPDKNDNNKNKILGQFYSVRYARLTDGELYRELERISEYNDFGTL